MATLKKFYGKVAQFLAAQLAAPVNHSLFLLFFARSKFVQQEDKDTVTAMIYSQADLLSLDGQMLPQRRRKDLSLPTAHDFVSGVARESVWLRRFRADERPSHGRALLAERLAEGDQLARHTPVSSR